jgi:hypothetical protein
VINPLAISVAAGILVALVAIVAVMTRRHRADSLFELGSVSQQWLTGHKDET